MLRLPDGDLLCVFHTDFVDDDCEIRAVRLAGGELMAQRSIDLAGYGLPYWLDLERPRYPVLSADARADVAVIGAGIAGLKLADYLSQHGLECIVLEAKQVGEGASSRNQGCIVTGLAVSYAELAAAHSREVARGLVALSHHNQELLEQQMAQHEIACDYEVLGETVLVRGNLPDHEQALAALRRDVCNAHRGRLRRRLPRRGGGAHEVTGNPLFAGGVCFRRDAQFHSGRFVIGLGEAVARSPRVRVFEQSPVTALESARRRCPPGAYSARQRKRRAPLPGHQRAGAAASARPDRDLARRTRAGAGHRPGGRAPLPRLLLLRPGVVA